MQLIDRTQQLNDLKKELFRIRFDMATNKRNIGKTKDLEKELLIVKKKIAKLQLEIISENQLEGQMCMSFDDEIVKGGK